MCRSKNFLRQSVSPLSCSSFDTVVMVAGDDGSGGAGDLIGVSDDEEDTFLRVRGAGRFPDWISGG